MEEMVVSADWVADSADAVRIVDVRDAWEYDGIGHVPGAVNVPFDSFRADRHAAEAGESGDDGAGVGSDRESGESDESGESVVSGESEESEESRESANDGGQGMLPGADIFADLLGEAGITREDDLVAYDDHHGVFAARFLVTAELYGHPRERLHLLDGDFSAWQHSHGTTTERPTVERTSYEVREPAESPLVDADAVAAAIDDPDAVIVDTREDWEFAEGHVPGAVWLDWRALVDDETRGLRPEADLRDLLESRGVAPDRRVVLYCNTARRISHTYVVLRHLGYPEIAFYEGSLTEWEAAGRPVETGDPDDERAGEETGDA